MKRRRSILLALLLFCVESRFCFSLDDAGAGGSAPAPAPAPVPEPADESEPRGAGEIALHGALAGAETLLSNGVLLLSNVYLARATWSIPTVKAIKGNFSEPWEWEDTDDFKVNQMGHPYQGALYLNAGRVNGFGFYQSAFFSALGSFTWEALCENALGAVNDFATTVSGSLPWGEMLFRLYLEACAAGVPGPIAGLLNPIAGFHRLVTDWEPSGGGNIYQFQAKFGVGSARTRSSISDGGGSRELFAFGGLIANLGVSLVYGNPFEQDSRTPYSQFDLLMSLGIDLGNYFGIRILSDGYLLSFSPVYTAKDAMSTGLTLHMDAVSEGEFGHNSTIDQYSGALDWTVKYRRLLRGDMAFQAKLHLGAIFLGVSEYYSPAAGMDLKNYGGGYNVKCFFVLDFKKMGKLEASVFRYAIWTYPGITALPEGKVHWLFLDAAYSYPISEHFSLGIADSFAMERGSFGGGEIPDTRKSNNEVTVFFSWNL